MVVTNCLAAMLLDISANIKTLESNRHPKILVCLPIAFAAVSKVLEFLVEWKVV